MFPTTASIMKMKFLWLNWTKTHPFAEKVVTERSYIVLFHPGKAKAKAKKDLRQNNRAKTGRALNTWSTWLSAQLTVDLERLVTVLCRSLNLWHESSYCIFENATPEWNYVAITFNELNRGAMEVRLCQTGPNRVSCFYWSKLSYIPLKWPIPNQSNGTSMMQPYLP